MGTMKAIFCYLFHGKKWRRLREVSAREVRDGYADPTVEYFCPVCEVKRWKRDW